MLNYSVILFPANAAPFYERPEGNILIIIQGCIHYVMSSPMIPHS